MSHIDKVLAAIAQSKDTVAREKARRWYATARDKNEIKLIEFVKQVQSGVWLLEPDS